MRWDGKKGSYHCQAPTSFRPCAGALCVDIRPRHLVWEQGLAPNLQDTDSTDELNPGRQVGEVTRKAGGGAQEPPLTSGNPWSPSGPPRGQELLATSCFPLHPPPGWGICGASPPARWLTARPGRRYLRKHCCKQIITRQEAGGADGPWDASCSRRDASWAACWKLSRPSTNCVDW